MVLRERERELVAEEGEELWIRRVRERGERTGCKVGHQVGTAFGVSHGEWTGMERAQHHCEPP